MASVFSSNTCVNSHVLPNEAKYLDFNIKPNISRKRIRDEHAIVSAAVIKIRTNMLKELFKGSADVSD